MPQKLSGGPYVAAHARALGTAMAPFAEDLSVLARYALASEDRSTTIVLGPDETGHARRAMLRRDPLPTTLTPVTKREIWSYSPVFPRDRSLRIRLSVSKAEGAVTIRRSVVDEAGTPPATEAAGDVTALVVFDSATQPLPADLQPVGVILSLGLVVSLPTPAGAAPQTSGPGATTLIADTERGAWLIALEADAPWAARLPSSLSPKLWREGLAPIFADFRMDKAPPALPESLRKTLFPNGAGDLRLAPNPQAILKTARHVLRRIATTGGDLRAPSAYTLWDAWVVMRAGDGQTVYVHLSFVQEDGEWNLERFPLGHVMMSPRRP